MRTNRLAPLRLTALALSCLSITWAVPVAAAVAQQQKTAAQATEQWELLEEHWMIVEIAGGRVGWMSTVIDRNDDQVRVRTQTKMTIGRGDASASIEMGSTAIETAGGTPVGMTSVQNMGASPIETVWAFADGKIKQTSTQGGRTTSREFDAPTSPWKTAWQATLFAREQRKAGVEEFTVATLDPQAGIKPVNATSKRAGTREHEIDGRTVTVDVWKSISDINPIEVTEYVINGDVVYQEIPMGIGNIVMRKTTKALAMAAPDAGGEGGGLPPELMVRSFAKPDKPIRNPMRTKTAKFRITAREGTLAPLPSVGSQQVEMSDDQRSAIITADVNRSLEASESADELDAYLENSAMMDFEDPLVRKLADRAKDESDLHARAEALRKAVNKHIVRKDMGTAFATASETARTQSGDCSEHGVLLAAMLRAQGIPSRVAMGLVYVDEFAGERGVFGWHMWAQALIDGKWIDFDATLPVRYTATHILTGTSSLNDGTGSNDMVGLMQLLGNIDIEVLEVGYTE